MTVKVSWRQMMTKTSDQEEDKTSKSGHGSVFAIYRNPPTMDGIISIQEIFPKDYGL